MPNNEVQKNIEYYIGHNFYDWENNGDKNSFFIDNKLLSVNETGKLVLAGNIDTF